MWKYNRRTIHIYISRLSFFSYCFSQQFQFLATLYTFYMISQLYHQTVRFVIEWPIVSNLFIPLWSPLPFASRVSPIQHSYRDFRWLNLRNQWLTARLEQIMNIYYLRRCTMQKCLIIFSHHIFHRLPAVFIEILLLYSFRSLQLSVLFHKHSLDVSNSPRYSLTFCSAGCVLNL